MTHDITVEEEKSYMAFCQGEMRNYKKPLPDLLWHYTNGNALISIIESKSLYSTQVSCLNDQSEIRYSVELLIDAFENLSAENNDAQLDLVIEPILEELSYDPAITNESFICCFSEKADDLTQWRAYGHQENCYSIGFSPSDLVQFGSHHNAILLPVNYDKALHKKTVEIIAKATLEFCLDGYSKRNSNLSLPEWVQLFLPKWRNHILIFAPLMKDSSFKAENEWRLFITLHPDDVGQMKYLQKGSIMTRHLPFRYQPKLQLPLPIKEIIVGPSRHKEISKISVGDLLRTNNFNSAKIECSAIPFRGF